MRSFLSICIIDTVSMAVAEAGYCVLRPNRKSGDMTDGAARVWLTRTRSLSLRMVMRTWPEIINLMCVHGWPASNIFSPGRYLRNASLVLPTISDRRE